jgi:hypothetical protein
MPTTSARDRDDDQELLDQAQAYLEYRSRGHDPPPPFAAARDQFYDCYAPRLRDVLTSWDMTAAERDDCLQEVWMSIVIHLTQFQRYDARACISTWLTVVARYKAMDVLQLRRRHPAGALFGGG